MPAVYILLGVQGSGKSTWAQANAAKLSAEVVSSDAIRNELESQGRHADAPNGDEVFAIFNARLERTLLDGFSMPQYCGDFAEVLHAFEARGGDLNLQRIIEYALKLDAATA
ncbi:MAG: AAA family ATPase, partial [Chloroflexota bacterium]